MNPVPPRMESGVDRTHGELGLKAPRAQLSVRFGRGKTALEELY
jgi:hypothetical protein